jgi:geranyl-CoA carboxylase alpha subunit
VASGQRISPFYDPLLAKIIAWGEDRATAIARLAAALEQTRAFGLVTNRGFLVEALRRPRFGAGEATTAFIAEEFPPAARVPVVPEACDAALAAVLQFRLARGRAAAASLGVHGELLDWNSGLALTQRYRYTVAGTVFDLGVRAHGLDRYTVSHASATIEVELERLEPARARLAIDGRRVAAGFLEHDPGEIELALGSRTLRLRNELAQAGPAEEAAGGGRITAPMHGVLLEVRVAAGERVMRDEPLAILEAMKMQHELRAPLSGTVRTIAVTAGAQVAAGELLLEIEPQASVSA